MKYANFFIIAILFVSSTTYARPYEPSQKMMALVTCVDQQKQDLIQYFGYVSDAGKTILAAGLDDRATEAQRLDARDINQATLKILDLMNVSLRILLGQRLVMERTIKEKAYLSETHELLVQYPQVFTDIASLVEEQGISAMKIDACAEGAK